MIVSPKLINTRRRVSARKSFRAITAVTLAFILTTTSIVMPFMAPTKVGATAPGYNGKIVYRSNEVGNNEIFTINSDGSDSTRMTFYGVDASQPNWSPDGSKIVYKSNTDGDNEIFTMNPDGSGKTKLTDNTFDDREPSWVSGGSKIVFTSARDGNAEVYIMNVDGSNQVRLTTNSDPDFHPVASPDGQSIAFYSLRSSNYDIYKMDINGSNEVRLTTAATPDANPKWSPDGIKIVFGNSAGNNNIYIMDADGGNQLQLTNDPAHDRYPAISPNGAYIAFTSARSGNDELYIMNIDGSNVTQITNGAGTKFYPDWQTIPNGAPAVTTDSVTTDLNTATLIDVLANDTDEEGLDSANLSISVQPTHGAATISSGSINYIPATGFSGPDQLTYQICDSFILDQRCATGVLSITVQPPAPAITISKVNGENYNSETNKYTTTNLRPTFSGTATPGSEITIEIHSDPIILTTTADGNGNWSITPTFDLPIGEHTVYISAILNGLTTELDEFGLSIRPSLANTGESLWAVSGTAMIVIGGFGWLLLKRDYMLPGAKT